jgi:hypothetical protein
MSAFPGSPRVLKAGIVLVDPGTAAVRRVIVLQYNPDTLSRTLQIQGTGEGADRSDATRLKAPPVETFKLDAEIDAADQLERPIENLVTVVNGLHPVIASLEKLLYPSYPVVIANEALALAGTAFILGEQAPLALLIWGPNRVLPVQVQSLSIKEEAFDQLLNPIRVKADMSVKVLTYRDLEISNPGYWVYLASFRQKETMSLLNTFGERTGIQGILPF